MPTHNSYYPVRVGDQIRWLRNYAATLPGYKTALGLSATEVTATVNDANRCVWTLETVIPAVRTFSQGITAYAEQSLNGIGGAPVEVPDYGLPAEPAEPANVLPGALKRILALVANLKTRPGYTEAIGEDLGLIGAEVTEDPAAVPEASAREHGGAVAVSFIKDGHDGVWIEGQVNSETEWTSVGVASLSPYRDERPLKVAGQAEKRRYRVCFWDNEPTRNWSDVIEVSFGG